MFITKTEIKLYLNKGLLGCTAIVVVLSFVAGLAGDFFAKDRIMPVFTICINDLDNSAESKLLVKALQDFKPEVMDVIICDGTKARQMVNSGEASAALIIPGGFFRDIMSGVNSNADLLINNENPIVSEIIELFANSVKEQLAAAQGGVYAVLSYGDENTYNKYLVESNIAFFSVFMGRDMETEVLPYRGLSNTQHFTLSFYIFMMFLVPCLLIEKGNIMKRAMPLLKASGVKYVVFYRFLSVFFIFLLINVPVIFVFNRFIGINISFWALLMLVVFQSAFCYLCIWLFDNISQAGAIIFLYQLFASFFSGGIIPLVFLPGSLGKLCVLTPNFHIVESVAKGFVSPWAVCYAVLLTGLAFGVAKIKSIAL